MHGNLRTLCFFAVIILHFGILIISVKAQSCPHLHYGSLSKKCNCTAIGSMSCHLQTGKCQCKSGFSGPNCIDIDECAPPRGQILCPERYSYCKNIPGIYECKCKRGYKRVASGRCYPCTYGTTDSECAKTCGCHPQNTASCFSETGICLCKVGWEGISCKQSENDCANNPCGELKCQDAHRDYVCVCKRGTRYVNGVCRDFNVQLAVLEQNPVFGQLMNVYILYTLSYPYLIKPHSNPDFVYYINSNDDFVCRVSFHTSHKRFKGRERILEMLNSNRDHQFYSHFFLRRSDPLLMMIKAKPKSEDIVDLISKSGQPVFTDHHQEVEIIPRNTLPLGLVMICVEAYKDNSDVKRAVAC
ncbi:hypothetical protein RRG08_058121, partial [Elysia crispata]